ncbi:hypothetical protein NDU88_006613 [Pleurodeles waltl]|uniref:Uncharacterized protein n=1 Tax=Pleurodeles waltl TaxID=8319 RepID=A0AAV7N951_PLEWA|nr:hypothetical protein NDU88_006613 [Pleurodeles waltl]
MRLVTARGDWQRHTLRPRGRPDWSRAEGQRSWFPVLLVGSGAGHASRAAGTEDRAEKRRGGAASGVRPLRPQRPGGRTTQRWRYMRSGRPGRLISGHGFGCRPLPSQSWDSGN